MHVFVYVLISTLTATLILHPACADISCDVDISESCSEGELLSDIAEIDNGFQFFSDEVVSGKCSYMLSYINCTQSYLDICGNNTDGMQFKFLMSSMKDFLMEFCDETAPLRKNYRQHISCLRESNDIEICVSISMATPPNFNEIDDEEYETSAANSTIRNLCRFYYLFKSCMVEATHIRCGDEASGFMEVFLTKPVENLTKEHC